jgi:hypothetical protein
MEIGTRRVVLCGFDVTVHGPSDLPGDAAHELVAELERELGEWARRAEARLATRCPDIHIDAGA